MVNKRLGNRGASRLGCLFVSMIIAAGAYYGVEVGGTFVTYYRVIDAMKLEARHAVLVDNVTMRRRLRAEVDVLDIPESALNFQIRRTNRPREVIITTHWTVFWEIPFYVYEYEFSPEVRSPI